MDGASMLWGARGGYFEGVTFRRPKLTSDPQAKNEMLVVEGGAKLAATESVFDSQSSSGYVARVIAASFTCTKVSLVGGDGGLFANTGGFVELSEVRLHVYFELHALNGI